MTNSDPDDFSAGTLIGYARVSTSEQRVEMQVEALKRAGVLEEDIYRENASGARKDRPQLAHALRRATVGDTVVVWKLDRIARSLVHMIELIQELKGNGVEFRSLTENIDTSTPAGTSMMHMVGAFAQLERDVIRERTREGVANAKRRGVQFGARKRVSDAAIAKAWKRVFEKNETRVSVAASLKMTTHQLARRFKEYEAAFAAEVAAAASRKKSAAKRRPTRT